MLKLDLGTGSWKNSSSDLNQSNLENTPHDDEFMRHLKTYLSGVQLLFNQECALKTHNPIPFREKYYKMTNKKDVL